MTSKELVRIMAPGARTVRGADEKWRVVVGDRELGWGWRPGSAWNAASHRLRGEDPDGYMEAIRGADCFAEYQARRRAVRVVVFLQNAWSPVYAGAEWPRASWLRALERSRSGARLRVMLDDLSVCQNTTRQVAATPAGKLPPDPVHIDAVLRIEHPDVVVCCGKQAELAVAPGWPGPLLVVPHPAHRLVTDDLYREARRLLAAGLTTRTALRQQRGAFVAEAL